MIDDIPQDLKEYYDKLDTGLLPEYWTTSKYNTYTTSTEVFCTIQFEGIHNWENCPFDEVNYLTVPHRHIFWIKAYKRVTHDDRDVEFIMLKHQIQRYLTHTYPTNQLGSKSCEMLARELLDHFGLSKCEVSEDHENGAIVYNHI